VVVALKPYGVPKSDALSVALVLHALNLFPYLVAGIVCLRLEARPSSLHTSTRRR
jgi:hypothetical protein